MINQVFQVGEKGEIGKFYEAMKRDRLSLEVYMKLIILGQKVGNFQSKVFVSIEDFKALLPEKSMSALLDSFIRKPETTSAVIKAAWNLDDDRVVVGSSSGDPPADFASLFDENFLTEEEKEKGIVKDQITQNVVVEVLKLDFLTVDKTATEVFKVLGDHKDVKVFKSKTVDLMITRVWDL